jgi:hypothetical protein
MNQNIYIPNSSYKEKKLTILENPFVKLCMAKSKGFDDWMRDKFLNWEHELIDDLDMRTLEESISRCLHDLIEEIDRKFLAHKFKFALLVLTEREFVGKDEMDDINSAFADGLRVIDPNFSFPLPTNKSDIAPK